MRMNSRIIPKDIDGPTHVHWFHHGGMILIVPQTLILLVDNSTSQESELYYVFAFPGNCDLPRVRD